MWHRLISWLQPAKAAEVASDLPYADQPPALAMPFDLGAYRQFMCDETYLYRASYIQKHIDIEGAEHYTHALAKGSVIVVFVHHGSWLLMNGALHHLCGGAPITSIASRRNLEFCTPEEKEFWLGVHKRSAESCKLAQLTGAQVVPAAIEYNAQTQRHLLTLYPSIDPSTCTPEVLTQNALDCIGPHVMRAPEQQFYDLLGALQTPQILQKAQ